MGWGVCEKESMKNKFLGLDYLKLNSHTFSVLFEGVLSGSYIYSYGKPHEDGLEFMSNGYSL